MDTESCRAFGLPTGERLSPQQELQISKGVTEGLRRQLHSTTQVLLRILESAGHIRDSKMTGCDRCSECTVHITKLVDEWFRVPPFCESDAMVVKFTEFLGFPRALVRLIPICLKVVQAETERSTRSASAVGGVVVAELSRLCDWASEAFRLAQNDPKRILAFCRAAAILAHVRDDIARALAASPGWANLSHKLDNISSYAMSIESYIPDAWYHEDRWKPGRPHDDRDPANRIVAKKRACGGGLLRDVPAEGHADPKPIYIVDFSRDHFLAVLEREMEQGQQGWQFFPCQRELPFRVSFVPACRDGMQRSFPTYDTPIRSCGHLYQLFQITDIAPRYYYRALCAQSMSSNVRNQDARLVDTYDWPKQQIEVP